MFIVSVIPPLQIKQKRSTVLFHPTCSLNVEVIVAVDFLPLSD